MGVVVIKILKKQFVRPIVLIIATIVLLAIFIFDFNKQISHVLAISNYEMVEETASIHRESAVARFNAQFTLLKSLSRQYTSWGINHETPIFDSMQLNVDDGNFTSMAIARINGDCFTESRRKLNVSDREYFKRALKGEMVVVKESITSTDSGEKVVIFAVPIYANSEVDGVLIAVHNAKSLDKLLSTATGNRSAVFITDSNGDAISSINCSHLDHPQSNVISLLKESEFIDEGSADGVLREISSNQAGIAFFNYAGDSHYMAHQPMGINEWHVFTMLIPETMDIQSQSINRLMVLIALKISLVFIALLVYVLLSKRKSLKLVSTQNSITEKARQNLESLIKHAPVGIFKQDAVDNENIEFVSQGLYNIIGYSREEINDDFTKLLKDTIYPPDRAATIDKITNQVDNGHDVSAKYRIITKSGERRWVNVSGHIAADENGRQWVYASMTDITEIKEAQDRLLISEQRYRILAEQSQSIIFDYDIATKDINYTGNYYEKFGNYPPVNNFPQSAIDLGFIYKEDESAFWGLFEYEKSKAQLRTVEIRLITGKGDYIWTEVTASLINDSEGNPVKFIGKILDIDDQKRHLLNLSFMAKTDQLTGLLNKTSGSALMNDELKRTSSMCALLVVDLDGFKQMNDTLGHLVGDKVLSDFSKILKKRYRSSDIISRFGGDEFTLLLKSIPDEDFVKSSCNQIIEQISELKYENGDNKLHITASIGIYFINKDDTQGFLSAYSKADQALYEAKSAGKACYSIYKEGN